MYVFIAIIFIAELIITGFIIYWLRKFDRNICYNLAYAECGGLAAINSIKEIKKILKSTQDIISNSINFVTKKRRQIRNKIINLAFIYILIIIFRTKYKKAATVLQYALFIRDFWRSIPV